MYIVHIRKRNSFSLVCTSRKAIKFSKVIVYVRTIGWPEFRANLDNRCVSFIQFMFSSIIVIRSKSSMTIMYVFVRLCI